VCVGVLCACVFPRAQAGLGRLARLQALAVEMSSASSNLETGVLERGESGLKSTKAWSSIGDRVWPALWVAGGGLRPAWRCLVAATRSLQIRLGLLLYGQRGHLRSSDLVASAPALGPGG
jgi:hypothetical protein